MFLCQNVRIFIQSLFLRLVQFSFLFRPIVEFRQTRSQFCHRMLHPPVQIFGIIWILALFAFLSVFRQEATPRAVVFANHSIVGVTNDSKQVYVIVILVPFKFIVLVSMNGITIGVLRVVDIVFEYLWRRMCQGLVRA